MVFIVAAHATHHTVRMPQVYDSVLRVLSHAIANTKLCAMLRNQVAHRHIVVFQVARITDRREQEMVRQKLQPVWLDVLTNAVDLNTRAVVNVHILALRGCEHRLVVQEAHVAKGLTAGSA